MAKGKIKFNFNIKKRILPVLLVSALVPLILFVAIPFEVFANNMDEFLFSLSSFYPLCVLFGFLLFAGTVLLLIFLPEKVYRVCYALVVALSFLFFLQGTFLNFGMNSLGGDKIGGEQPGIGLKILDSVIWIVVLSVAVALALVKDKKGIIAIIAVILSIAVAATQIVTPITSTVKHPDVFMSREARLTKDNPDYKDKVLTNENLTAIASERNIIFFLIDRFDEYYAQTAFDLDHEFYDTLDGFTWFKDNISFYCHTFPSVAYMLNEKKYDMEKSLRKEYLSTVYQNNNTMSLLYKHGYSINLYTSPYYSFYTADTLPEYIDNVSNVKEFHTSKPAALSRHLITTSAYRCLPLIFKNWVHDVESREFNECVTCIGENGCKDYDCDTKGVAKQVIGSEFGNKGERNFSFIHVEGCHDIILDYSGNVSARAKREVAASVGRSFRIVNKYIKVLKEKNLYKDATIIITGDHPYTYKNRINCPKLTALFFKRSGYGENDTAKKGELTESFAPVAQENIWDAIFQSENITRENAGTGLYEIPEYDRTRERTYTWQTYGGNECFESVYSIKGSGIDFNNWKLAESNHYDRFIMT